MKTIQVDRSAYDYLVSKASPPGEAMSSTLRRELHVPEPSESIEIDDDSYAFLLSKAVNIGESASDILRRVLHLGDSLPSDGPNLVVFHILAGTGPNHGTHRLVRCRRKWVTPCALSMMTRFSTGHTPTGHLFLTRVQTSRQEEARPIFSCRASFKDPCTITTPGRMLSSGLP